jgi:hypothetical protein
MSGEHVAFAAQPHAIDEMASYALAAPAAHVAVDAYLLTAALVLALRFVRHRFAPASALRATSVIRTRAIMPLSASMTSRTPPSPPRA